jgi:hypothetical protein
MIKNHAWHGGPGAAEKDDYKSPNTMNGSMNPLNLVFAVFALPILIIAVRARNRGRRWAGIWLLVLAPLYLPMAEDGFLATWYALATPQMDPDGARGLLPGHTLGHMPASPPSPSASLRPGLRTQGFVPATRGRIRSWRPSES